MIPINRQQIDGISKQLNSKQTLGYEDMNLYPAYASSVTNLVDTTRNFSTYEMSHWINNTDRWLHNQNTENTIGYKRRTILFADLGASNFRYEPSFTHPCIVLAQNKNFLLIVPCSSKKYGRNFPDIIDATIDDGFSCNTGIQIKHFRWISKNRVISSIGSVSSRILNLIDLEFLKLIPSYKLEIHKKDSLISQLQSQLDIANTRINFLEQALLKTDTSETFE